MEAATYKAIIFDMGEVLVKTYNRTPRTKLASKFNLSFEELESLVYFSNSAVKAMRGEITEYQHFRKILQQLNSSNLSASEFQNAFWGGDDIDEELISFINSLRNKFKFGLLSNAMDTTRERLSRKYNLLNFFDCGIFSSEVKMAKPQADIYKLMIQQLNVKPQEAIFIDDFVENIEAAYKLGITSILHKSTSQTLESIRRLIGDV